MANAYDDASLAFIAELEAGKDGKAYSIKPTDGSGDFTFSRGSNLTATRVGADGLIEKGRENLLENSVWDGVSTDTKPTNWANQFISGTGTFDVTSIEGQIRFQTLDASSRAFIYSPTIDTNGILTVSIYVDEVNNAIPLSNLLISSANATALFAYENGVEINYTDNVQANKRYSVVFNKTASTTFRFGVGAASSVLGDIVISRPQIEVGLVATEYIASPVGSTGKAGLGEDEPRFDYSGGATCPSLLLEPQQTDEIGFSEYFGGWTAQGSAVVTDNYATSPDGYNNAARLQLSGTNDYIERTVTSTSGVLSIYAKGTGNIILTDSGANNSTTIALTSQYQRIPLIFSTNTTTLQVKTDASGLDATIYGANFIGGASYLTSYIPNHSGGTATRGAESFQNDTNTSPLGTIGQGTWFVELQKLGDDTNQALYLAPTTSNTQQIRLHFDASNARFRDAVNGYATIGGSVNVKTSMTKMALSIDTTSGIAKFFSGGSQVGSDYTLQANPFEFSRIVAEGKGFILKQSVFYPTALSDTECEALTAL